MEVLGGTATLTSWVSGSQGRVGGGGFGDSLAPPKEKQRWLLKETAPHPHSLPVFIALFFLGLHAEGLGDYCFRSNRAAKSMGCVSSSFPVP